MGPLGTQEMIAIFILALLLFGPKKLPELGRTVAKALAEFRRASNDLKQQFEREMSSIEKETQPLKEIAQSYHDELNSYNYDHSYYDAGAYGGSESNDTSSASQPHVGASETSGAESTAVAEAPAHGAPEGTVAHSGNTNGVPAAEPAHADAVHHTDGQQAPEHSPKNS
jgi:sec-independent protein translocase protein TatA